MFLVLVHSSSRFCFLWLESALSAKGGAGVFLASPVIYKIALHFENFESDRLDLSFCVLAIRRALGLKSGGELWDKANAISMRSGRDIVAVWKEAVRKGFQAREDFWLSRLKVRGFKKMTILFVCGAGHVDTFKATLAATVCGLPSIAAIGRTIYLATRAARASLTQLSDECDMVTRFSPHISPPPSLTPLLPERVLLSPWPLPNGLLFLAHGCVLPSLICRSEERFRHDASVSVAAPRVPQRFGRSGRMSPLQYSALR